MKHAIVIGSMLVFTATTAFSQEVLSLNEPVHFPIHRANKEQREENSRYKKGESSHNTQLYYRATFCN